MFTGGGGDGVGQATEASGALHWMTARRSYVTPPFILTVDNPAGASQATAMI